MISSQASCSFENNRLLFLNKRNADMYKSLLGSLGLVRHLLAFTRLCLLMKLMKWFKQLMIIKGVSLFLHHVLSGSFCFFFLSRLLIFEFYES